MVNERSEYALHRALGCLEVLGKSMGVRAIGNEDLRWEVVNGRSRVQIPYGYNYLKKIIK